MTEGMCYNAAAFATDRNYRLLSRLREKNGSWEKSWNELRGEYPSIHPEAEWRKLKDKNIRLTLLEDQEYPRLLREIASPPLGIYVQGTLPNEGEAIGIVGTRKATTDGKEIAMEFARKLSEARIVVISGLALGIDAAAHLGALSAGGKTLAVVANGLDSFYPRTNEALAKKIVAGEGAIISEYPMGSSPLPHRFLERNRIVSGLSRGIVVIEAPSGSGSLVTANFAIEQNRDVFVVPGSTKHQNFKGSHGLIRNGAQLVTSPEEILEAYGLVTNSENEKVTMQYNKEEHAILTILKKFPEALSVDKIVELSNLNAQTVNQAITFLLIKNSIQEMNGGYTLT